MSKLIQTETAKLNVFELDLSKTYFYQILSLSPGGHGGMAIRIFERWGGFENSFGIYFSHVDYMLGPTQWKGGVFRSATHEECYHLRKSLKMHTPSKDPLSPTDWELNDYALFELATDNGNFVRILASTEVNIYDNWGNFVQDQEQQLLERVQIIGSNVPILRYQDGAGEERDFRVDDLLKALASDYPVKDAYNVKPEDIQAALLFASQLIKKTYGSDK